MELMKRVLFLLSFTGALLSGQDLSKVHFVYLLPMGRGLDQYLANRLTQEHVFEVVTDPKLADAVFSDRIGASFEEKLADLKGNPEPVSPPPGDQAANPQPSNSLPKLSGAAPASTFGTGKGTVFLVDLKSHRVVWSAYQPPKSSSSGDMNRTASAIVSRLKRDLKPQ
jgi:hypothetical protein